MNLCHSETTHNHLHDSLTSSLLPKLWRLPAVIVATGWMVFISGCASPAGFNTYQGGILGTAGGALVGAAIGADSGKPLEGAAIGALAGGTLGSAAGNQIDGLQQEQQMRQQQASAAMAARALTLDQVIELSTSGVSSEVIANQIRAVGVAQPISTQDVIYLKNRGVADAVIVALQTAGPPLAPSTAESYRENRPLVVEERVYVAPGFGPWGPYCAPYPAGYRWGPRPCPPRRTRAGLTINF